MVCKKFINNNMQKYTLEANHIELFPVDGKTTIFFHSETLQIYPLQDTTLGIVK
jgi:hypothetical protein